MLRNILGVIVGLILGSVANMLLLMAGSMIFPLPEGIDASTVEGFKAAAPFMKAEHFVFPFLAHAVGTLFGAFVAAKIGLSHKLVLAMIIGVLFLCGGIIVSVIAPVPMWFVVLDLVVAYLPMAYLGHVLATSSDRG